MGEVAGEAFLGRSVKGLGFLLRWHHCVLFFLLQTRLQAQAAGYSYSQAVGSGPCNKCGSPWPDPITRRHLASYQLSWLSPASDVGGFRDAPHPHPRAAMNVSRAGLPFAAAGGAACQVSCDFPAPSSKVRLGLWARTPASSPPAQILRAHLSANSCLPNPLAAQSSSPPCQLLLAHSPPSQCKSLRVTFGHCSLFVCRLVFILQAYRGPLDVVTRIIREVASPPFPSSVPLCKALALYPARSIDKKPLHSLTLVLQPLNPRPQRHECCPFSPLLLSNARHRPGMPSRP